MRSYPRTSVSNYRPSLPKTLGFLGRRACRCCRAAAREWGVLRTVPVENSVLCPDAGRGAASLRGSRAAVAKGRWDDPRGCCGLLLVPHPFDVRAQHGIDAGLVAPTRLAEVVEHVTVDPHVQVGLRLGQFD